MNKILIVSGHPNLIQSIANATILEEVAQVFPDVEIRRLDELYPSKNIDVLAEQQALLNADIIVWQFPFAWYSMPGIMKIWLDEVFTHGFAHGSTAQLSGKKLILSFTTGAPQNLYSAEGFFGHEIEDYLIQFKTTAVLCHLDLQKPIYSCGISYAGQDQVEIAKQKIVAQDHASRLIASLAELASDLKVAI